MAWSEAKAVLRENLPEKHFRAKRGAVRRVPGGRSDATTGRHPAERSGAGMPQGAAAKRKITTIH